MIPQVIHYCWFGRSELPPLAKKCIESWKKFFPNYEIKEWNEDNFDVSVIPYTKQAYRQKKFAFVSDYARFKILYEQGGIYFDTDVEVIKPMEDIIEKGSFMGLEIDVKNASSHDLKNSINPGLGFAVEAGHPFLKELLCSYERELFSKHNPKTITQYTSELFLAKGFSPKEGSITDIAGFKIYPKTFFCPYSTKNRTMEITSETRSIHHYATSWVSKRQLWIINHRYISLFLWLLKRPISANINGLIRVIKERSIF